MAAGAESSRAHGAGRRGVSKERAEALFDLLRDDLPEVDERSLKLNQHLPPAERERVVEFIAEVCDEFGLQIQTAGLAISYFDRYACKIEKFGPQSGTAIAIERAVFACVLIGAKFMETKVPAIGELRLFGAMEHSRESIKQAELEVLDVLGWGLSTSTPHTFLAQLAVIMDLPEAITTRSEFLIDMSYYEHRVLEFSPMLVAGGALLCSLAQLSGGMPRSIIKELTRLCRVDNPRLLKCKEILLEHFNLSFGGISAAPKPPVITVEDTASSAEADKSRDESSRASTPNSITATFDCLLPNHPQTAGGPNKPAADGVAKNNASDAPKKADARPYEFSPLLVHQRSEGSLSQVEL